MSPGIPSLLGRKQWLHPLITIVLVDKQLSQMPTECFQLSQPPGTILSREDNLYTMGSCRMQEEGYLKEGGPDQVLKATV